MKRWVMVVAMVLAPYTLRAQVYEWSADSLTLTPGSGVTLQYVADTILWMNAFNDGFVKPGHEYKIVRTDSSIQLVEAECWKRWLDQDSVSHCGHDIRNGPVDTTFEHGRFVTEITKIYWCEDCKQEFRISAKVATRKAE